MIPASRQFWFAALVLALAVCSCWSLARTAFGGEQAAPSKDAAADKSHGYPPPPTPHRGRSPFADIKPEEVPTALGMSGLICDWFDYPVTKGEGAFQPMYLPFDYSATVANPDLNESYTFAHLLSLKADWIPDNTCRLHPFFIFQREPDRLPDLVKPSPALLTTVMKSWGATHAVGGTLRETPDGWSGSVVVYDLKGQPVFSHDYGEPRDYFKLMADMTAGLFAFRQCPLSAELRAELERKCTTSQEALRAFGRAATVRPRTEDEWSCYEKALALDPDFAEARFWYGNQKGWTSGNEEWGYKMRAQALKSHFVFTAATEAAGTKPLDAETARGVAETCQKMLNLAPENPQLLAAVARNNGGLVQQPDEMLVRLEDVVRKHPGLGGVLHSLAWAYYRRGVPEKAIPMALSETGSGYFWPRGEHSNSWAIAGSSFELSCADWKRAFTCTSRAIGEAADYKKDLAMDLTLAASILRELGRFRQASRMFQKAQELEADPARLRQWICCLYEGGFPDEALEVQEKYKEVIRKNTRVKYMTEAAQEIYYGKDINSGTWRIHKNAPLETDGFTPEDIMLECVGGYVENVDWRDQLLRNLFYNPWDRLGWILLDLWEKQKRTEVSDYFYETYVWLHADDVYFSKARGEFMSARPGPAPQLNTAHVLDVLTKAAGMAQDDGYDYARTNLKPMFVEWHIKRLLEAGDFDSAEKVAAAYETAVRSFTRALGIKGWTHFLHRRVMLARQQAGAAAAGRSAGAESPR